MKFSVIVTCYNREDLISRCIASILNQSYTNFELIVVDDCSTDNSVVNINKFRDERIKLLINLENKGQNYSLNKGIEKSKGEFISFLDSDDYWESNFLQLFFNKYSSDPSVYVVYSWYVNGQHWLLEGEKIYHKVLQQGYLSCLITLSFRRECLNNIFPLDTTYTICQDDKLCFELAKSYKVALIKIELAHVNFNNNSSMTKNYKKVALGWEKLFYEYQEDILLLCGYKTWAKHLFSLSVKNLRAKKYYKSIYYYIISFVFYVKKDNRRINKDVDLLFIDYAKIPVEIFLCKIWKSRNYKFKTLNF